MVALRSGEITVRNKVSSENFPSGTLFHSYFQGNPENPIFIELVARKKNPSKNTCNKIVSPRFSWK
jgi:hypothetical protein